MPVSYVRAAVTIAAMHSSLGEASLLTQPNIGDCRVSAARAASTVMCDTSWRRSYSGKGAKATAVAVTGSTEGGVALSPLGLPFPVQSPGPTWKSDVNPTGTSFLPAETVARAEKGNPIEKAKLAKDASTAFNSVYEYAAAVRSGEMNWEDVEKADMNTRLKWVGLVHRDKRTPGRFMMRLRLPNGVTNADSFRFYADSVEPHGPDLGVIDITTRQNIQLRGVQLEQADEIIDGLHARGQTSFHSALDNVRNMVGSPLAGIDCLEMVGHAPLLPRPAINCQ